MGFVPEQEPLTQVSVCVQTLLSVHAVPSGLAGFEHTPEPVSQVPTSWQSSSAVQTTGFTPEQEPLWQVSVCVQALLSVHALPSGLGGLEQVPDNGLHTPASWHWSS